MRSGTDFERLFKLWSSVWNLVFEEKRHLQTVMALLQKIVFEAHGYPRFKNWPEICKLWSTDPTLMMVVATTDISSNDDIEHQLISAFPQCFSDKEVCGPIPLSVILETAHKNGVASRVKRGEDYPVSHDGVPKGIPVVTYDITGSNTVGSNQPHLPAGIDPDAKIGDIVVWDNRKFVVLENNEQCDEMSLAPAECVRVDL